MSRHFGGRPVGHSERIRLFLVLFSLALLMVLGGATVWLLGRTPSTGGPSTVVVQKEPELQMTQALVPLREIQAGVQLQPAMFKQETRPAAGLDKRAAKDFEEIAGQYSRTLLIPGQPLHLDQITNVRPPPPSAPAYPAVSERSASAPMPPPAWRAGRRRGRKLTCIGRLKLPASLASRRLFRTPRCSRPSAW